MESIHSVSFSLSSSSFFSSSIFFFFFFSSLCMWERRVGDLPSSVITVSQDHGVLCSEAKKKKKRRERNNDDTMRDRHTICIKKERKSIFAFLFLLKERVSLSPPRAVRTPEKRRGRRSSLHSTSRLCTACMRLSFLKRKRRKIQRERNRRERESSKKTMYLPDGGAWGTDVPP